MKFSITIILLVLLSQSVRAADYAQLDSNNVVTRVVVIADDNERVNGVTSEAQGIYWCQNFFGGGVWLRTAEDGSIRKNYASVGYVYHVDIDAFVPSQPYPSWVLDAATTRWKAPLTMPTDGRTYRWDEPTLSWVQVN